MSDPLDLLYTQVILFSIKDNVLLCFSLLLQYSRLLEKYNEAWPKSCFFDNNLKTFLFSKTNALQLYRGPKPFDCLIASKNTPVNQLCSTGVCFLYYNGCRFSAVLSADSELDVRSGLLSAINSDLYELADSGLVE